MKILYECSVVSVPNMSTSHKFGPLYLTFHWTELWSEDDSISLVS